MATDDESAERLSLFGNYSDYARAVRAWLVAYGIGGPVLFVTNDKVSERVARSGFASEIILLFLAGVALQILSAMINKWAAWFIYRGVGDSEYQANKCYRFWSRVNEHVWLDVTADLLALAALGGATWRVLSVFLSFG